MSAEGLSGADLRLNQVPVADRLVMPVPTTYRQLLVRPATSLTLREMSCDWLVLADGRGGARRLETLEHQEEE